MAQEKTLPKEVQERIERSAEKDLNRVLTDIEGKVLPEKVEALKTAYLDLFVSKESFMWFRIEHANTSSNEMMLELGDKIKALEEENTRLNEVIQKKAKISTGK